MNEDTNEILEGQEITSPEDVVTSTPDDGSDTSDNNDEVSLASRIYDLEQELKSEKDRYLRLLADFDNYKKNMIKQRDELLKYQGQPLVIDLLEVIDNFEYAILHSQGDPDSFRTGVELIRKRFLEILEKWGIRSDPSVGKPFDPAKHNAIGQETSFEFDSGTVVRELKSAFFYVDKLLRPAEVVVSVKEEQI
jgi:molecular chaperone GrpE